MSGDARRHEVDPARGATTTGVVAVLVAVLLGFLLAMLVYRKPAPIEGGSKGSPVVKEVEDVAYAGAKVVTVTATSDTTLVLDSLHVHLSKPAGDVAQWHNTTDDTLLMFVTGAPAGELIPPHRHSAPFRVCVTCDAMDYPYHLYHRRNGVWEQPILRGPPTEPSITVED